MASPNPYPAGFNLTGTVFQNGPDLLQLESSFLSGLVQWVDTIGGNNANAGTQPELPVATLAQAVTNSAANGLIIIGEGSAQSIAAPQTLNLAGLHIVGCGAGSTRPRYTVTGAPIVMFDCTAANTIIENFYFPAGTGALSNRIGFTAASGEVRDCYFECGTTDTDATLHVGAAAANTRVSGCTFLATGARPAIGLHISAAVADVSVEDCTFDGGSFGWSDYAFKVSAAATRIKFRDIRLRRFSDFGITVTATTYKVFGLDSDGLSRWQVTA